MKYRPEIDGLRALAVIPVIFFHAGFQYFGGGFVGVDIFFVISGYLITSIILTESQSGKFSLKNFYLRRIRRIFPALFFVMLVCLPLAWFWLIPNEMRRFSESLVAVSTFSSNVLFYLTSGYFDGGGEVKPLLHTWSLAVEEQYYLIFPLYLILIARLGRRWLVSTLVIIAVSSFLVALKLSHDNPVANFLLLPSRLWELLFGGLIAFFSVNNEAKFGQGFGKPIKELSGLLGLGLIVFSILYLDKRTPYPGVFTLLPIVGSGLIIIFSSSETVLGKILGSKLFVGFGLISYSLYLWHQPLFAFARQSSISEPSKALFACLIFVSIPLSYFTYKFIEGPFRNKQFINNKNIFICSLFFILLFISIGVVGRLTDGFPNRMPAEVAKVHISRFHEKLYKNAGCVMQPNGFDVAGCIAGDKNIQPKFALIGDSHGQAVTYTLGQAFNARHLSFVPLVKSGCRFDLDMPRNVGSDEIKSCAEYQHQISEYISKSDIDTFILVSRWDSLGSDEIESNSKAIFDGHIKSIQKILDSGKTVVLVYPIPAYKVHISDYMTKNLLFYGNNLKMISDSYSDYKKRVDYYYRAYEAIGSAKGRGATNSNLVRIYPDKILCNTFEKDLCSTQRNGSPLYFDESHLSNEGSSLLVEEIMSQIK
jgi:peptidoglycan/LPS O-acetylase OafA/YrhL